MYVPPPHRVADDDLRAMVAAVGSAELVTVGADGYPAATLLPIVWRGDEVVMHMARANEHWRAIAQAGDDAAALLVVDGLQAYVSPSWYPSKAEHGRVVPTWNYSSVQLRGRVRVIEGAAWLRDAVTVLTEAHEGERVEPWQVTDAPEAFIAGQLRGIVGLSMTVESAQGKAKWSQNRSVEDRAGVRDGLFRDAQPDAAARIAPD